MSVSLVVLRFELADGFHVPDIAYEAKSYPVGLEEELRRIKVHNSAMNKTPPGGATQDLSKDKHTRVKTNKDSSESTIAKGSSSNSPKDKEQRHSSSFDPKKTNRRSRGSSLGSQDEHDSLSASPKEGHIEHNDGPGGPYSRGKGLRESGKISPLLTDGPLDRPSSRGVPRDCGRISPLLSDGLLDRHSSHRGLRDGGRISPAVTEEVLKTQLGKREFYPIQIETYVNDGSLERLRSTPSPIHSEVSGGAGGQEDKSLSKIPFFSGNPMVDCTNGILHLYKRNSMTSIDEDVDRSEMICMLAVPAKFTCSELLKFVAPVGEYLEHIRVIKDNTPNQYMVLLKFRGQKYADEFYRIFNGQQYNSLEDEVCNLIYVAKVEAMRSSEGASLPTAGLTELPTCPVCLERMDESVEGVLTILCNHSFHGSCLVQWSDTICPVCRYCQTPEPSAENQCSECDSCESLWICLICGHIGCGRYLECHAFRHYEQTLHTYAMDLNSQRVWDYAGDNYVHRLAQNKADGKLVELGGSPELGASDEKLDSLNLEYTYLLTSQLESQRLYFEEKISRIEKDHVDQMNAVEERSKKTLEEYQKLEHKLCSVEKERRNVEKKYTQVAGKVGKLVNELKEEKELNKCLRENQSHWQEKVQSLESKLEATLQVKQKEVSDLQEQVTDLFRHLEAQQLIASSPSETRQEIQEGQITLGETPPSCSKGKTKRKR